MAPEADADLAWWAKQLEDQTISPLTRDYPETTSDNVHKRPIEAIESLTVPSNTLTKLSDDLDATPVIILQTALIVLVSRLTGDEDISIGSNSEENGSSFVLKTILDAKDSFSKVVQQVQKLSLEAAEKPVSQEKLRAQLQRPVLFRFAAFNTSQDVVGLQAETIDLLITYTLSSMNDLKLTARYNQRLISGARIAGILGQITTLLQNAATDVNAPVGGIDFATPEEKKLLPDPTSDLEWSNFRGAIHDIFAANAEAHPDRTCVVETKSEDGPERTFTYQQIHHGSSVLAHHLLRSGLQLGEVVMIYSYRGVDLVVAVMGVLKAGGTFSVLDPAYPPDRQNIYLDVSRPRALVIIEKATQDAGELSEKVRNFIKENLHLRTEVPALRLNDDGSVQGGQLDGKDVFEEVQSLKATRTGVVVGPDSTPTLSFTSGSEGMPKGVKGRHHRAYYFDWMAKTFNLSDKDKFTMLSGIAHDPIQRDMFTPLFLGAQLLVPSKNDIQNERLAEWMREVGATVSHLTPAMGQILVGGAVATFDKLHHAFFVGDILIKRDCRSLQNLAPNVRIVNIYYEIPSRAENASFLDGLKDVIPAGKGMANVQMLVVNRHDRTKLCAVGELGEIYVRASGLAEEYLGTPELSRTKFVDNWFPGHEVGLNSDKRRFEEKFKHEAWAQHFFGPRDRLYRSGDLGRYTPDFDVECSGRADFQVKIRGYRLELNEIDTHLSQHPLVRENVTLVRRDKFEEQILVSYVVPQMSKWEQYLTDQGKEDISDDGSMAGRFERFRLLQQSVQEYLRTKLPVYAVPSIIVPMKSMPLNPNGKIDRPKLPFPDADMLVASRRRKSSMLQNLTESELAMAKIWAELVPGLIPKTIKPTESFFEIGGDSMSSQRLAYQVRKTLGVNLAINKIYNRPTLKDMAAYIDHIRGTNSLEGGETNEDQIDAEKPGIEYGQDALDMAKLLPQSFRPAPSGIPTKPVVFLTGATGFLGCFILQDLLLRKDPEVKVIVLVRAKDEANAMSRLKMTCQAYGVWSESWSSRIQCVTGSLGPDKFGLSDDMWKQIAEETDVVIHNGAQVHWINTYEMLKPPNVLGTVEAIKLCAEGKPKSFAFVSSTSVLDHDHFVAESERIIAAGGEGVSEEDDLSGSSKGLTTGYGQSKWVGESLVREAGRRGLRGYTVRPGYILGHTKTGVTVTDDFLVRMLKGCVQLKTRPNMGLNTINMAPVDHVARAVVACAFNPPSESTKVACISGNPKLRFNQFLATLQTYGYNANLIDYIPWCSILNEYVTTNTDFALMPLFTFVANDLPANSVSIELDDTNTEKALYADREWSGEDVSGGSSVTRNTVGLSLAYLVAIGFLPPPSADNQGGSVRSLPVVKVSDEQKKALLSVGGRGGMS